MHALALGPGRRRPCRLGELAWRTAVPCHRGARRSNKSLCWTKGAPLKLSGGRAGQGTAGHGRAGEGRAEQVSAVQGRAGQGRARPANALVTVPYLLLRTG